MKTSTIVAATVGTLAVATIGYAIYFDQKRRSDPEFRRKLSTYFSLPIFDHPIFSSFSSWLSPSSPLKTFALDELL